MPPTPVKHGALVSLRLGQFYVSLHSRSLHLSSLGRRRGECHHTSYFSFFYTAIGCDGYGKYEGAAVIALVVMGGWGQDWVDVEEEWETDREEGKERCGWHCGWNAFANAHSPPPTPFQPFRAILVISPVPANAEQPMQKIAVVWCSRSV